MWPLALVGIGSLLNVEQPLLVRALPSPAGHVAWTRPDRGRSSRVHARRPGVQALLITVRRPHPGDRTRYHRGATKGR